MTFDKDIFPWEVVVILAILLAMLTIFSLVRWVFAPRPKRLPAKRLFLFLACMGTVFYAYRFVDNFPAKFTVGLKEHSAATTDDPLFPELRTVYFTSDRASVFNGAISAIEESGWTLTNRSDSGKSLRAEISSLLGFFTDDITISLTEEGGRTRVDIQSASRKDQPDLGSNRRHIAEFLKALEQQLGMLREYQ